MENNIETIQTAFFRNLGNGILAGESLEQLFIAANTARDTTIITRAMTRAVNEKQDEHAASTIRVVAGQVWPGAKMGKTKDGNPTIKIKGVKADEAAFGRLRDAVERKLSIRHATFRKVVKGETGKPKADLQKTAANVVSKAKKEGWTEAAVIAAIKAEFKK